MGHECMGAQMGVGLDGSGHGAQMYGRTNGRGFGWEWAWGTNVWAHLCMIGFVCGQSCRVWLLVCVCVRARAHECGQVSVRAQVCGQSWASAGHWCGFMGVHAHPLA